MDWVFTSNKFHEYNKPSKIKIGSESEKICGLSNQYISKFVTFEDEIEWFIAFICNFDLLLLTNAIFLDIKL